MEISGTIKLILLGVLALFDIICLGLLAYFIDQVTDTYSGGFGYSYRVSSPSEANFMMFNAVWTILVLVYLAVIPRFVPKLYHSVIALGLCALTTLFWFAGSIALAVRIGAHTCDGPGCGVYRSAQAATAFGFFIWIIFTVLTVFEILGFMKSGFSIKGKSGGNSAQMTTQQPQAYAGA